MVIVCVITEINQHRILVKASNQSSNQFISKDPFELKDKVLKMTRDSKESEKDMVLNDDHMSCQPEVLEYAYTESYKFWAHLDESGRKRQKFQSVTDKYDAVTKSTQKVKFCNFS